MRIFYIITSRSGRFRCRRRCFRCCCRCCVGSRCGGRRRRGCRCFLCREKSKIICRTNDRINDNNIIIICPIAIAYSMRQLIKSVCVCVSVCLSVRLRALSRSHFLIDFHQNRHRFKNHEK